MEYAVLRHLHITCALLSVALFALRATLQWRGLDWRRSRLLRVLPHVNDSVLLGAAVALAWQSGQTPWTQPWLGAKVLALLAYILAGREALRRAPGSSAQLRWTGLALACVSYILVAAHWRRALPPLL